MKTLIITTLTSALLSFNSFADTTSDINNIASMMAKDGLQQMNVQLTTNLQSDIQNALNVAGMHITMKVNSKTPALLAKVTNKNRHQVKNTVQAAAE